MRTSVSYQAVAALLDAIEVDARDVARVEVTPDVVTVTEFRRDEDGDLAAGVGCHGPLLVTTEISIDREESS